MNALAVSVFLALNLAVSTMPLDVVMLDDPLQTLDEINMLGLVDLLRRLRERRQVLVSTHDVRWAALLERKLRPVHRDGHARFVELRNWSREGPEVVDREVAQDVAGLRVVA
jgi:ABC-type cobalamin/Fe3+-siderophores transport system ATPase subunit